MLYHDINHVNINNETRVCTKRETENCNFSYIFLNRNDSVIIGAKLIKFATGIVNPHLEGTVSQIFDEGPSFYFMKSRKFC